jgi:DNA-binding NtrC family response regulator
MLAHYRGNKSAAADALGISRKKLYALLHGDDLASADDAHSGTGSET